ncbi:MAG: adenosylcobinamide-GDP ribazoletransferase [Clostridiales bacterium]|nr:adenosylcobinamide-GDP ribazoletransferase [Clostridiales bacterium]
MLSFLQSLAIALSMYSLIPMPRLDWREDNMRWSLACLPVVGLLAGVLLGGWSFLALHISVSPLLFAAVAVLLPVALSGGFHMDGFLDAVDALFSRRDREEALKIMKDPRCGPFAVLCCGGLLLLGAGAWSQLLSVPVLLPAACTAPVVSRALTVAAGSRLPYASSSTLGVLFASRSARGVRRLSLWESAAALLLLPTSSWLSGGLAGLAAGITATLLVLLLYSWYRRMVLRRFGGVTGDLLGFFVTLCELALPLALAVISLFF